MLLCMPSILGGSFLHCEFNLSVSEYFCHPVNSLDFSSACGCLKTV